MTLKAVRWGPDDDNKLISAAKPYVIHTGHADFRSTTNSRRRCPAADGSIRRFWVDQAAIWHLVATGRDRRLSAGGRPCPCAGHEMAHGALGSQAMPIQARFAGLHVIRRIRNPI
jgi:hypothetical protein